MCNCGDRQHACEVCECEQDLEVDSRCELVDRVERLSQNEAFAMFSNFGQAFGVAEL